MTSFFRSEFLYVGGGVPGSLQNSLNTERRQHLQHHRRRNSKPSATDSERQDYPEKTRLVQFVQLAFSRRISETLLPPHRSCFRFPPSRLPLLLEAPCRRFCPTARRRWLISAGRVRWVSSPSAVASRTPTLSSGAPSPRDPPNWLRSAEPNELLSKTTE